MKNEMISIIVPVYNVEKYIERCLTSLINQSYRNIEIIVIDDGSTDKSGLICDRIGKIDKRIKIVHQKNGGLSLARNVGIDYSKGEYITFVDGDDFIDSKMCEVLLDNLKTYDCDISICKYYLTESDDFKKSDENYDVKVFKRNQAMKELMLGNYFRNYAWAKIYKRDLWNNVTFPVGKLFEDVNTIPYVFNLSRKIVYSNYTGYAYFQRPESIVNSKWHVKKLDWIDASEEVLRYYQNNYPEYYFEALNAFVYANIILLNCLCRNDKHDKKLEIRLRKNILSNCTSYLKYKNKTFYNTTKNKMEVIFIKYLFGIYKILVKLIK